MKDTLGRVWLNVWACRRLAAEESSVRMPEPRH
jgi:hypothetical protein